MASFFSKKDTQQRVEEAHANNCSLCEMLTEQILAAMDADESYQAVKAECVMDDACTLAEINADRRIRYRRDAMDLLELEAVERSVDYLLSMARDPESLREAIHAMSAQRVNALFHAVGDEYFARRKASSDS